MVNTLVLNGTSYPLQQLADVCAYANLSPYERQVVQFAQQWLSGQETFTVQTSGSTGAPKPILLTRTQMVTSARLTGQAEAAGDGEGDGRRDEQGLGPGRRQAGERDGQGAPGGVGTWRAGS